LADCLGASTFGDGHLVEANQTLVGGKEIRVKNIILDSLAAGGECGAKEVDKDRGPAFIVLKAAGLR
jgi:hypothetical protein